MYIISEKEKELITLINHPVYSVDFLEKWINRNDDVVVNAPVALQTMGAKGFFQAVRQLVRVMDEKNISFSRQCH